MVSPSFPCFVTPRRTPNSVILDAIPLSAIEMASLSFLTWEWDRPERRWFLSLSDFVTVVKMVSVDSADCLRGGEDGVGNGGKGSVSGASILESDTTWAMLHAS